LAPGTTSGINARKKLKDKNVHVVFPVKHYKDEGFVERKIEINEEDLPAIIENISSRTAILNLTKLK
jgi:hypothetical protein